MKKVIKVWRRLNGIGEMDTPYGKSRIYQGNALLAILALTIICGLASL